MFVIVNENKQTFSRMTATSALIYSEHWSSKIQLDQELPINITIFPNEGIAGSVINNILACRGVASLPNKNENLIVVPFTEYFGHTLEEEE